MGETMSNCPTCGGSGNVTKEMLEVFYDDEKRGVGRTTRKVYTTEDCKTCNGMGVIPGGPPV